METRSGNSVPSTRGLPGSSDGDESACNAGGLALVPGLGRNPEEGGKLGILKAKDQYYFTY